MTFFKKLKTHVTRWFIGLFLLLLIGSELLLQLKKNKADIPATLLDCNINQHHRKSNYLRCTYQFERNNQHYIGESERASVTLPLLFWIEQARHWHIQSVKNTPQMVYFPSHTAQTHQMWLHENWQNTLINTLAALTNVALFLMLIPLYILVKALRKKVPWLDRYVVKATQKSNSTGATSQHVWHTLLTSTLVVTVVFGVLYFGLLIYLLFNAH